MLSHFSRVRLSDPTDSSPPGSPVPGILQARTLEWVKISIEVNNVFHAKVSTIKDRNGVDLTEAKGKGEKERYTHPNAEFQRIARRERNPSSVISAKQ